MRWPRPLPSSFDAPSPSHAATGRERQRFVASFEGHEPHHGFRSLAATPSQAAALDQVTGMLADRGFDGLARAVRDLLDEVLKLGVEPALEPASSRCSARSNGDDASPPRRGPLATVLPSALDKGTRSERAFKLAVAEAYFRGSSTRRMATLAERLCGPDLTGDHIGRAAVALDFELKQWQSGPLERFPYLLLDARKESVHRGGSVVTCDVMMAVGIDKDGRRAILGTDASASTDEPRWGDFLDALRARGLHGVRMVTSDAPPGLKEALDLRMPGVLTHHNQSSLIRQAMGQACGQASRAQVAKDLDAVFEASDRAEAETNLGRMARTYRPTNPGLADFLETSVPDGLTVFSLPRSHRGRLRRGYLTKRLNVDIARRTRLVGLFSDQTSALRLVSAILMEIGEDWLTKGRYLTIE